jgi:psiF repeat
MKLSSLFAAAAISSLLIAGPALAQNAPAAKSDTAAAPAMTEKKAPKARSAESVECSKEADAKGLHGKERKKFRSECVKSAKAGAAGAPAGATK